MAANGGASITGTLGVSGATTLSSTLGVTGATTLSSTLGVLQTITVSGAEGITSPKFKATNPRIGLGQAAPDGPVGEVAFLRADGDQEFIKPSEIIHALGYIPADSGSISGDFPLGNSLMCDDISSSFNGSTTDFSLTISGNPFIPAGSSANLIVSIGGVIQKPASDFIIVTSGGLNTNTIRFTTAPASGVSCFIIALGGQGSLISNLDWDTKGQILVATGDNAATRLPVGSNGTVLTADSTQASGVKWGSGTPTGSVFYMAASSADTATGGSVTISAVAYHAPEGYLICNGGDIPTSGTFQGVSASLLQNLRNFLGGTYGAAGRLPNLLDRFAGYSAIPGTTGGSADATLVSHSHTGTTDTEGNHSHTALNGSYPRLGAGNTSKLRDSDNTKHTYDNVPTNTAGEHTHTFTTSNEGSSATDKNLPPYVGMLPVIKY